MKAAVLKTARRKPRGFESSPLRQCRSSRSRGSRDLVGEVTERPKVLAC